MSFTSRAKKSRVETTNSVSNYDRAAWQSQREELVMQKQSSFSGADSLTHVEARKFWREYFGDEQDVSWAAFSAALSREFALAKSDVECIRQEMDANGDNKISVMEFNIFTVKHGVACSLQRLMHATEPPPKRGAASAGQKGEKGEVSPWLVDYVRPPARVSTWQPGRDQQARAVAYREVKVLMFSTGLIAFVMYVWTFEAAMAAMQWVEGFRVAFGLMSFLDFCGSTLTCYNYRCEAQRLTKAGDERLRMIYRTAVGFYAQTMLKCNFMQFGGTTVTALILGQPASWLNSHVWAAFIVAYWLVFCSPGDVWFKLLQHGWLLLPIKAAATVSAAHALSSWGVDKALTAEHPKIHKSVWGALVCGFASGSLGGMVAGVAEEGEAWLTSKAPTWPMQRAFYMVQGTRRVCSLCLRLCALHAPNGRLPLAVRVQHAVCRQPRFPPVAFLQFGV